MYEFIRIENLECNFKISKISMNPNSMTKSFGVKAKSISQILK